MDYDNNNRQAKELKSTTRIADQNNKSYKRSTEATLRKQRIHIEKLKKDNEVVKEQLANLARNVNMSQTVAYTNKTNKLVEIVQSLKDKIRLEKLKIEEVRSKIEKYNNKIKICRKEMEEFGGVNISKESTQNIDKQIRVLENRLDKALQKFNEALAYNKKLRDTIENLRQERVVFDNIYKKMERELQEKKKDMAKVIESSNAAYEDGDEAQRELAALKATHQLKMHRSEAEFEELEKLIQQNEKLNEKINAKNKEGRIDSMLGATFSMGGDDSRAKNSASDKSRLTNVQNKIKQYEDMLSKIEQATGNNIDTLIKEFSTSEDSNFSLFTYVNELNTEIEKLEEQISEMEGEFSKYKGDGDDGQRKQLITELQDKLQIEKDKVDQYDQKYGQAMQTIQALTGDIQVIFDLIGCDANAISEMLGTSGITETNMMIYLGLIEQRTNFLLNEGEVETEQGPKHPYGSTQLTIAAPSTGEEDESDDDVDDERPLTREELMEKIAQKKKNS
jgi:chromosome segregation ATPase